MRQSLQLLTLLFHSGVTRVLYQQVAIKGNPCVCEFKVLKRTFRIGESLKDQKVSVLVSNKTIRKEISNNDIALKQTSMLDVRRYLVKHGDYIIHEDETFLSL